MSSGRVTKRGHYRTTAEEIALVWCLLLALGLLVVLVVAAL